jgi:AcrR family transcriptional regulator
MGGGVNRKRRAASSRLPGSLRAAWGLRAEPIKGPRPALSLKRIVEAALDVASSGGIGAVAMSRIATELGVGTMSLYRYVEGKNELLALMMDAAFEAAPAPPGPSESWRAALSRWTREHLAVLRRHPWVLRIPLSGPPIAPNQVLWFERGLACLSGTGLAEGEKLCVLLLVNGFVRNEAFLAADLQAAARASGSTAEEATFSYSRMLSELIDPQRFPAISAVLAARVFEGPSVPDAEFDFGLERILDGVAVLVREG